MMEVVVTTGAVRRAKLHYQQNDTEYFTGWMPFLSCHPTNSVEAPNGKAVHPTVRWFSNFPGMWTPVLSSTQGSTSLAA